MVQIHTLFAAALAASTASARPFEKRIPQVTPDGAKSFTLQNGQDAQKQNVQFAALSTTSPCAAGQQACVSGGFAQCIGGKFQIIQCSGGTQCFALPLVNKTGTSITCTTSADATSRIAETGATGGIK